MADFCRQCSFELFGEDRKDLAGLGEVEEGYGWAVLCERCGPVMVDNEGKRIDPWNE